MINHKAEAIVITCIDYRIQEYVNRWISENLEKGTFDRAAFAGGVLNWEMDLRQIEVAYKLHHIKKVILINHEDCGVYGENGQPITHALDLKKASDKIKALFSDLEIQTYYLRLDGTFEQVS